MTVTKQYKSAALAAVHEMIEDAHAVGTVSKTTMRDFDQMCLSPVAAMHPEDIRALREREQASQAVFARVLSVSPGLISQ